MSKRDPTLFESGIITADQLLQTGPAMVYSITLAWKGAAVGDFCTLKDGLNIAAADEVVFVFPTANGTITKEWPEGKHFATGLFFNKGAMGAGAAVYAELTIK